MTDAAVVSQDGKAFASIGCCARRAERSSSRARSAADGRYRRSMPASSDAQRCAQGTALFALAALAALTVATLTVARALAVHPGAGVALAIACWPCARAAYGESHAMAHGQMRMTAGRVCFWLVALTATASLGAFSATMFNIGPQAGVVCLMLEVPLALAGCVVLGSWYAHRPAAAHAVPAASAPAVVDRSAGSVAPPAWR